MLRLKRFVRDNGTLLFLFLVLFLSLSLNVVLGWRVRALEASYSALTKVGVREGTVLPTIQVLDTSGNKVSLDFSDKRGSVLYILSPTCIWCKRNRANIVALASLKSSQNRFVGLSTTAVGLSEYVRTSSLPFPIYALSSPDEARRLGILDVTPQTVLVSTGGTVRRVWTGAFQGSGQQEIERFFGVKLPGIQNLAPN